MMQPVTPGVTIREIASFPPSVAEVATAIPGFVGHVQNPTAPDGSTNLNMSKRITSLIEFEEIYGIPQAQELTVTVTKSVGPAPNNALLGVDVAYTATGGPEAVPAAVRLLYHSMRMFYDNGGGPCWVHAIATGADVAAYSDAFTALESVDEVTLLLFPDATSMDPSDYGDVVERALTSCNRTQDRFVIADVPDAHPEADTPVNSNVLVGSEFRDEVGLVSEDFLKYGAAYMPFLRTSLPILVEEDRVTFDSASSQILTTDADGNQTGSAGNFLSGDPLLNSTALQGEAGQSAGEKAVVDAIRAKLRATRVMLPSSPAVAGIYARVDRTRGVHHAPANVGIANAIEPALPINAELNGQLNVDATSGKSVNAIRSFTGRGTLVWGARTLAGNSNDNRYVNVRRFLNFAEESIGKAIGPFVFAPNDPNTWVRVRTMIENFLTVQWRNGALVGPKPEQAFFVRVGLNQTMTNDDILNGRMIVRVGLAISRPAEFIILEFQQIQQQA